MTGEAKSVWDALAESRRVGEARFEVEPGLQDVWLRFTVPAARFPSGGKWYRVEIKFDPATAGQDDFKAWFTELITAVFDGDVSIECKDSEQQPDTYETQVHCSIQSASNLTALKANRIIEAVSVLVESVGRSYGRFMTLHGFEEPRVAQPAAADGRFAKAKER